MHQSYIPDWNSFISAIIGGLLALLGTYLTIRGTKKEREKEDSRELITLFYFLSSKVALLAKLGEHPEGVPLQHIVTEDELLNVRRMYAVASRAITLEDIGEVDSFCNNLRTLESARKDCISGKGNKQLNMDIYGAVLLDTLRCISPYGESKIGKRIEYYFSKELKHEFQGQYKYK